MRRVKIISLGVAGIVVPVVLVFSAFLIARGSIGAAGTVPPVPQTRVSEGAPSASPSPSESATQENRSGTGGAADDQGGRCSEPEHLNDPECSSGSGSGSSGSESGSSGSGSGSGGGDDSPNSGHGSSGSGSGSGDSGDD
jgi:hypothetical protein